MINDNENEAGNEKQITNINKYIKYTNILKCAAA